MTATSTEMLGFFFKKTKMMTEALVNCLLITSAEVGITISGPIWIQTVLIGIAVKFKSDNDR